MKLVHHTSDPIEKPRIIEDFDRYRWLMVEDVVTGTVLFGSRLISIA